MKKKARTFSDYWLVAKWLYNTPYGDGSHLNNASFREIKKMCRNAYNAGLRQGKKKRPRAVKP